jgi:uncharacterized protein (TIGR00251 family)
MLDLSQVRAKLAAEGAVTIPVKVIPRAAKTECSGFLEDGSLKIKLAAVPDKGKANAELRRFLAELFEIDHREVSIVSGETSPRKLVRLKRPTTHA